MVPLEEVAALADVRDEDRQPALVLRFAQCHAHAALAVVAEPYVDEFEAATAKVSVELLGGVVVGGVEIDVTVAVEIGCSGSHRPARADEAVAYIKRTIS